jgi:hypothetical protein
MFSVYVDGYIRGTRRLGIKEARSLANTLRREYPKMFAVSTKSGLRVFQFTISSSGIPCLNLVFFEDYINLHALIHYKNTQTKM